MSGDADVNRILVVDDDVIMGELLSALMIAEGYGVTQAGSGAECLRLIRENEKPNVILFDMHMPGMHGGELAEALQTARTNGDLPARTVLLAMSGSIPETEATDFFDGFLRKPFTTAEFAEAVRSARAGLPSATAGQQPMHPEPMQAPALDDRIFEQLRSKIETESLRQLYDMTLDDVRARLSRIATAAGSGDQSTVRREAHTIKGSCGMVGALELQALAAATEGGSPVDTSALADFDSACQRLQRMLDERL